MAEKKKSKEKKAVQVVPKGTPVDLAKETRPMPKAVPLKVMTLTTDGKSVKINMQGINILEAEMMLMKSLTYVREMK